MERDRQLSGLRWKIYSSGLRGITTYNLNCGRPGYGRRWVSRNSPQPAPETPWEVVAKPPSILVLVGRRFLVQTSSFIKSPPGRGY